MAPRTGRMQQPHPPTPYLGQKGLHLELADAGSLDEGLHGLAVSNGVGHLGGRALLGKARAAKHQHQLDPETW